MYGILQFIVNSKKLAHRINEFNLRFLVKHKNDIICKTFIQK